MNLFGKPPDYTRKQIEEARKKFIEGTVKPLAVTHAINGAKYVQRTQPVNGRTEFRHFVIHVN